MTWKPKFAILVTGGRDYGTTQHERDAFVLTLNTERTVREADGRELIIVNGGGGGAAGLAGHWANENAIPFATIPANWLKHGKAAGPIRNQAMVDLLIDEECMVIAFPGGRGTADCVMRAKAAGIPVMEVTP